MCHKFLVLPVKKWLKSMHIYGSYRKIKTGTVFLDHSVFPKWWLLIPNGLLCDSSTDFYTKWVSRRGFVQGRAFWSKNENFFKPLIPKPPKPGKFGKFLDLKIFGQNCSAAHWHLGDVMMGIITIFWSLLFLMHVIIKMYINYSFFYIY